MSFSQVLTEIQVWVGANLPIAVGGTVAIAVLTILFITNRQRRASKAAPNPSALAEEKAANWAPPEQSYADRRGTVRREGVPVRVTLASATFRNGVSEGYVLDRSTGGLRIAMQVAIAPGSAMQVRAINAPDTVGFVTLLVRSCRLNGDHYEVGCEFEKTPPWSVLLLFG